MLKIAVLGSGAVGGYYGAKLARAGHDVTFIARGAHLQALRERGMEIRSPAVGDFTVQARAEDDTSRVGAVDLVIVAVKAYDNATALPMIRPMLGPDTTVLTLQNGVDSVGEVAANRRRGAHPRWHHLHRHRAGRAGCDRADRHAPPRRIWRSVRRLAAGQASA